MQARAQELSALRGDLGEVSEARATVERALSDARAEMATLHSVISGRDSEVQSLRSRVGEIEVALGQRQDQLRRRDCENAELYTALEHTGKLLDDVRQSRTWRWMAPARALVRLLRGVPDAISMGSQAPDFATT